MPRGMLSHHYLIPLLLPPGRYSEALGFLLVLVLSLSCSEEQGNDSKSSNSTLWRCCSNSLSAEVHGHHLSNSVMSLLLVSPFPEEEIEAQSGESTCSRWLHWALHQASGPRVRDPGHHTALLL